MFVENQNAIISTEHGPKGGDEININRYPSSKIMNFGYPISSYGEHYSNDKYLYEEAPLYKSHKDYGFEEPVDYFVPSIGISDVEKYNDKYLWLVWVQRLNKETCLCMCIQLTVI